MQQCSATPLFFLQYALLSDKGYFQAHAHVMQDVHLCAALHQRTAVRISCWITSNVASAYWVYACRHVVIVIKHLMPWAGL